MRIYTIVFYIPLFLLACSTGDPPIAGTCTQTPEPICVPDELTQATGRLPIVFDSSAQFRGDLATEEIYKPGAFSDQVALAVLIGSGKSFDLRGIMTSNLTGNAIENQVEEVQRVLALLNSNYSNIKRGATGRFKDIVLHLQDASFDGADAVNFLIDSAHQQTNEKLSVVVGGKITNVSLAIAKDPSIVPLIKVYWHVRDDKSKKE